MGAKLMRTSGWSRSKVVLIAVALALPTIATAVRAPADAGPAPFNIDSWAGSTGPSASAETAIGPVAMVLDGPSVFVADYVNNVIRRFDRSTGTQQVVAGIGGSAVGDLVGPLPDGIPATAAMFRGITDLTRDRHDGLIVGVSGANRVRRIDAAGIISTIAGTGASGFSGDGGPATAATFTHPSGVVVNAANEIFVADAGNDRVRKIAADGIVTTVAGGGAGGGGGLATDAALSDPTALVLAPDGSLVIGDLAGVHRVDAAGTITTVAALPAPFDAGGLVVDPNGVVFSARNAKVQRIGLDGTVTTVAGTGTAGLAGEGGPATAAQLDLAAGLAFDGDGSLLIADSEGGRVLRVDASGTLTRLFGNTFWSYSGDGGPAARAQVLYPFGLARDAAGDVFVADALNGRVRKIDPTGVITTVAGRGPINRDATPVVSGGDGGPALAATFRLPVDVAVDAVGNLYVADSWDCTVRRIDTAGIVTAFAGNKTCGSTGDGGPAEAAQVRGNWVVTDAAGNVYVSGDLGIRRIDTAGVITTIYGAGPDNPGDGGPASAARFSGTRKPTFDSAGNLYFPDGGGSRIRRIDTAGVITTVAGTGTSGFAGDGGPATQASFRQVRGMAVAPDGTIYLADFDNNRIRRIDPLGVITTISGDGPGLALKGTFGGDGGPAADARWAGPSSLLLLGDGTLLSSDLYNSRVRRIGPADLVPARPGPDAIPLGLTSAMPPEQTTTTTTAPPSPSTTTTLFTTASSNTTELGPTDPAARTAVEAAVVTPTFTG